MYLLHVHRWAVPHTMAQAGFFRMVSLILNNLVQVVFLYHYTKIVWFGLFLETSRSCYSDTVNYRCVSVCVCLCVCV